jgi:hypothetical protein
MSRLEDLLREAYGQERFRVTVTEIESRARKARRRRATLAVAGGLAAALAMVYAAVPMTAAGPNAASTGTHPCAAELARQGAQELARQGASGLLGVQPVVAVSDRDGRKTYIYSDGNATFTCQADSGGGGSMLFEPNRASTPLLRTMLAYTTLTETDQELIFGPVPEGIREFVHFAQTGSGDVRPLASNDKIFFGYVPYDAADSSFRGVRAIGERAVIAKAFWRLSDPLATPESQESACRSSEQLMPVPHIPLTTLDRRELGGTIVILFTGPAEMLAVCTIDREHTPAQVGFTIANRPIYQALTGSQRRSLLLMQAPPDHGGTGRVLLSNGRNVPLVFDNGHATAVLDLPEGVEPDHVELDKAPGETIRYP